MGVTLGVIGVTGEGYRVLPDRLGVSFAAGIYRVLDERAVLRHVVQMHGGIRARRQVVVEVTLRVSSRLLVHDLELRQRRPHHVDVDIFLGAVQEFHWPAIRSRSTLEVPRPRYP